MLICVTGGTGFVGSHSVAAVLRAGFRVRLVVRDPARVAPALAPLGIDPGAVDVAVADVTDRTAVAAALRGADAVLHAASVYSFDSRRRSDLRRINELGTEVVLDAARRVGADPVVYVSSVAALMPAKGRELRADLPVGRPRAAYPASKAAAEAVARRHQGQGAPVVITYPPALLGPHDPHLGDQTARLRDTLRGLMPLWPTGGFPLGDVRDTAALHAALFQPGPPAPDPAPVGGRARYFGPNHYLSTRDYLRVLRSATGRRLPTGYLPARAMYPFGLLADCVQHVWPWHIPAEFGAVYTCACAARVAEGGTFGISARPAQDTMADTVGWLYREGRITARQAGSPGRGPEPEWQWAEVPGRTRP